MPLIKSKSKAAVRKNVAAEMAAGKPQKQAVAIALDVQRRAGGGKPFAQRARESKPKGRKKAEKVPHPQMR